MKNSLAHLCIRTNSGNVAPHYRHKGMALVLIMVILMILTILGITSLRTSAFQQTMAGNTQESARAFMAADSGMAKASQPGNMPTQVTLFVQNPNPYSFTEMGAQAVADAPVFVDGALSPDSSGVSFCEGLYDQRIVGTTTFTGASSRVELHQGLSRPYQADTTNPDDPC